MIDLSIVVPVYNAQQYLTSCIDSILSDGMTSYEIILIDDGSQDESGRICDIYEKKHPNIKVFHIENKGVSNARNIGIEKAQGKWIMFMDADDELLCDVNELIKIEKDYCDGVYFNYKRTEKGEKSIYRHKRILNSQNILLATLNRIKYYKNLENAITLKPSTLDSCWAKLYKTEIIKENNIIFDEKLRLSEDTVFNVQYLLHTNKILCVDQDIYYYRNNEQSVCNNFKIENISNRYLLIKKMNRIKMNKKCSRAREVYCICILLQLQQQIIKYSNIEYVKRFFVILKEREIRRLIEGIGYRKLSQRRLQSIKNNVILFLWKMRLYKTVYFLKETIATVKSFIKKS